MMRSWLLVAGCANLIIGAVVPRTGDAVDVSAPLKFNEDGNFQISIFEDIHLGENAWDQWGPQQDINTMNVVNQVLDNEDPSLVVFNGDLITGENAYLENGTAYIDMLVTPLIERSLTWASTYGNHDYQFNVTGATILAHEQQYPNARTKQMVKGKDDRKQSTVGVSNYYLPVYHPKCYQNTCPPALLLWFFDSKGGWLYQQTDSTTGKNIGQPDWVDKTVVDWFVQTNAQLVRNNGGTAIPSLAFVHIPTRASVVAQQAGIDGSSEPGVNDDMPLAVQAQGWCADGTDDGDRCSYGGQDVPFSEWC